MLNHFNEFSIPLDLSTFNILRQLKSLHFNPLLRYLCSGFYNYFSDDLKILYKNNSSTFNMC